MGQRGPLRNAYGVANEAWLGYRKWLDVHINDVVNDAKLCCTLLCRSYVATFCRSLVKFGLTVWLVHCAVALQVLWPCGRAVWSATMLAPVRAIALLGWALGLRHAKRRPMARKKPDGKG